MLLLNRNEQTDTYMAFSGWHAQSHEDNPVKISFDSCYSRCMADDTSGTPSSSPTLARNDMGQASRRFPAQRINQVGSIGGLAHSRHLDGTTLDSPACGSKTGYSDPASPLKS